MKLSITEGADPNYLATIVKIPKINNHPNADKLELVEVFGNTIVVGKGSYIEGESVVYFPVESAISQKFLSWANLLDKAELNADGVTKGFFGVKHGRVKAISLRSIPSQGFLFKVSELAKYYEINEDTFKLGDTFDTVGDDVLVTKYIKGTERQSNEANSKKSRVPAWLNNTLGYLPRPIRRSAYVFVNAWFNRNQEGIKSQIVEGQFKLHYKTEQLGKNIWIVEPDDQITVTNKVHGTSAIYANILCKKSFNPLRSMFNWIGGNLPTTEYKFVYSSRSVLKNRKDGKYTDDVWGVIAKELDGRIPSNSTLYGEIVGYTPSGKVIQKGYDYGVNVNKCEFWLYRATHNLPNGEVYEYDWSEIVLLSQELGIKHVPIYYQGLASSLFNIPIDAEWHSNFLSNLKEKYLDKICELCTTGVVNEGIILRNESKKSKPALKFKSPKFLIRESEARDNNEEDMEENS